MVMTGELKRISARNNSSFGLSLSLFEWLSISAAPLGE
jgi:hypothetical protein